jgi:hypothetical protein
MNGGVSCVILILIVIPSKRSLRREESRFAFVSLSKFSLEREF